jgi:MoaA/NifB/PqqE/SkfB family radical SAM enzyme
VAQDYGIDAFYQPAMDSLFNYIQKLKSKYIIAEGNGTKQVFGVKGNHFPLFASVELTNQCNFHCLHCYKEATNQGTFLSLENAKKLASSIASHLYSIDITGGEATLHPEFSKIIDLFHVPVLNLITNGFNIDTIDDETLKRFSQIQVSLYGYSDDMYVHTTGCNAFQTVCMALERIRDLGIYTTVAVILKQQSMEEIEKYFELLDKLRIYNLRFGLALKIGRNKNGITEWNVSEEERSLFHRKIAELNRLYSHFDVGNIESHFVNLVDQPSDKQYRIVCGAGESSICISEKGFVRPCVMFPEEYFGIYSIDEYISSIKKGECISYKSCLSRCSKKLKEEGRCVLEVCPHGIG